MGGVAQDDSTPAGAPEERPAKRRVLGPAGEVPGLPVEPQSDHHEQRIDPHPLLGRGPRQLARVDGSPVGRRVVLGMIGLGMIGVLGGRRASDALARLLEPITNKDPTGLTSLIPTGGGFRYYSIAGRVDVKTAETYRLEIGGLVDRPVTYTLAELQALPQIRMTKDFQCVTGWRVADVKWTGIRLSELLDRAGVQQNGAALRFRSFDGLYTESLTLKQAHRSDVIVALTMLGKPVTHDHGGPVRLYVAPMYGYKSLKWLDRIDVTDRVQPGYWERLGYDVDGWVGDSNGRDDDKTT